MIQEENDTSKAPQLTMTAGEVSAECGWDQWQHFCQPIEHRKVPCREKTVRKESEMGMASA